MLNKIKEFFTGKKPESNYAHPLDAVTTPYKVEPLVTGTYDVPPAPGVTTLLYVPPATEQAPAVVEAAPEQKARKPRAPKAAPVAAVKEKAPAKAKAPKKTKPV